jgi:hypothetical protein
MQNDPPPEADESLTSWERIVRNMRGALWTVTVSIAGQPDIEHEVPFSDTAKTGGLLVGTVPSCHVHVPDASAPPTKLRITAASNHALVEILEGAVSCCDRPLSQRMNRFDWLPLSFGQTTVKLDFRSESKR